ncbi:MAG: hypothetical protein ABW044_13370, partial [Cellvibrio sp.]
GVDLANLRKIAASPSHDANHFSRLLQFVRTSDLRKLLSDDPHSFQSLEDKQVVKRVASLMQSGSIVLFEFANSAMPEPKRASSKPSKVVEEFVDVSEMKSSSELAISQPATPKMSPTPENTAIDEQAQVAVLIAAAKSGAAFCEKCSKQEAQ